MRCFKLFAVLALVLALPLAADESSDLPKPPPLPRFKDPYASIADAELKEKIPHLKSQGSPLELSREIQPETGAPAILSPGVDVEIVLPKNRCETGYLTWGSPDEGYTRCRVLGRGQTIFASLRHLAGLKATQGTYRSWIIAETPLTLEASWIKQKEHFGTDSRYDYCMFKPDTEYNGATIRTRPNSTIGRYVLDTGARIHSGKKSWGTRLGSSQLLMPVRMTPVVSPANKVYSSHGDLIRRSDFWIHSHENPRDEMALEASSTYGCPRLPRACEEEFQVWVAARNAMGKLPLLQILEE